MLPTYHASMQVKQEDAIIFEEVRHWSYPALIRSLSRSFIISELYDTRVDCSCLHLSPSLIS